MMMKSSLLMLHQFTQIQITNPELKYSSQVASMLRQKFIQPIQLAWKILQNT